MKVVVGLSGGVDSAVTAYLLKEQGYEVHGLYVSMLEPGTAEPSPGTTWQVIGEANRVPSDKEKTTEPSPGTSSKIGLVPQNRPPVREMREDMAYIDAKRIAKHLGIEFASIDYSKEFNDKVIDYFTEEYLMGRTPNPCIRCNKCAKWGALIEYADSIGAEYIATGHYARISKYEIENNNTRYTISNSKTASKDQTYVLYELTQEMLSRTLMPLGDYTKEEVRNIALKLNLPVADKPDSQDICFIPDKDYMRFLSERCPDRLRGEGDFVSEDGKVIGRHKGIEAYTIGQRKGLGIAMGHPMYVKELDRELNRVILSDSDIYTQNMKVGNLHFMAMPEPKYIMESVPETCNISTHEPKSNNLVVSMAELCIECTTASVNNEALKSNVLTNSKLQINNLKVKIRYAQEPQNITVVIESTSKFSGINCKNCSEVDGLISSDMEHSRDFYEYIATVEFEKPVRAVTPGQAAVFYLDDKIMFGGTIL